MAKKIRQLNHLKVDLFQAVKRAYLRRGVLPVPDKKARTKKPAGSAGDKKTTPVLAPEAAELSSAVKEEKAAEEGPEKAIELAERTHEILYEATTVFPFTLVPDTVTLDREKLTFANRFFWRVANITSVPVGEIQSAQANVGPFFGSLHVVFSFFVENERSVRYLWRDDALELQRMIHGYIVARNRKIDTTQLSLRDLKVLLKDIGQGASD